MKRTLIILAGLLMICTNLYAAGDLIVDGNLGVRTVSPQYPLDVSGSIRLLSPDTSNYALRMTRSGHEWALWHMGESYDTNDFQIWEYKTGSDGLMCGSTTDGMCDLRFVIEEGGNAGIGALPGSNNKLYVTSNYTDINWGRAGYFYNTARATVDGAYKNYGLMAAINPVVDTGVTNSGYAIAIEASPLNTSTETGTLQVQAGIKVYYGNYDSCGGSCGVGTIKNAYGVLVSPRHDNGEITNSYGVYIGNPVTGGIVTNNWGFYQASADMKNYFAGQVGIGATLDPNFMLTVGGGGLSATVVHETSDQNLKANIKAIDSPLKKVMDMKGVSFSWKIEEFKDRNFPEGRHYGVIAQEIEKVLPDVVADGANGEKSVAYSELIPVLIEAMKEQQKEIESLKAEIELLKPQKVAVMQ